MSDYNYPKFGAGLWHFANYIDRYAVDGYGPALTRRSARWIRSSWRPKLRISPMSISPIPLPLASRLPR